MILYTLILNLLLLAPESHGIQVQGNSLPMEFSFQCTSLKSDTVKYSGYRLDLINFQVVKAKKNWVTLRFDAINSGRENVDFGNNETAYWVQLNFDPSFSKTNLNPLKENVRVALMDKKFNLETGKIKRGLELKVSTELVVRPAQLSEPPIPPLSEPVTSRIENTPKEIPPSMLFDPENNKPNSVGCPDIYFKSLTIVSQNNNTANVEYTIANQGHGPFELFYLNSNNKPSLMIRAYISGAAVMSKGALPIGGYLLSDVPGQKKKLLPGESISGKLQLDVRKKTRYLKSLILSLDSDQFARECDKTNNTGVVILE